MRLLERHRERQAKRVALIHSMQANGEAPPPTELGITGKAVAVAVIGGIVAVIHRLLGG